MERGRTLRGEELRDFLQGVNQLGYPARPPPASWKDPNDESQESFPIFGDEDSQQFYNDETSQIPPGWESSDAIA